MIIRPVTQKDHAAMMMLAEKAGYGMTSLPQDAQVLEDKILYSEASFTNKPPLKDEHRFLLVMEDPETGEIVGSTGVKAHVGLSSPFYSYKLSTLVQASREPEVYSRNRVLHMVNDYTGVSEIGSLFLRRSYRRDGLGKCLSRCRFLLMAQFPEIFDEIVIAEMRGVHDENGHSPFYGNLAKHFFKMPFREADYINATKGGQFIADLMPRYPIYETLLAPEAQAVIGVVNEASKPAVKLLEREGFRYAGYLDIFDAGPTIQAETKRIRTAVKSREVSVAEIKEVPAEEATKFVLITTELANLRIIQARVNVTEDGLTLAPKDAEYLQVNPGDKLRVVEA
jgi:arginine N-succinyltransferase